MASRMRLSFGLGLLVATLALAACGGSPSSGMSSMPGMSHGDSTPTGSPAAGGTTQTVSVTLADFKIASSQTAFKTGTTYHFVVTNTGQTNHELMVMPPMSDDGMSMDEMDKMALYHISQSDLPPGATKSFDLTFNNPAAAGQLELACHVGSHYKVGMHESITVTQI
jgi:uncharacterized cupredoxin-like copper-binding protein